MLFSEFRQTTVSGASRFLFELFEPAFARPKVFLETFQAYLPVVNISQALLTSVPEICLCMHREVRFTHRLQNSLFFGDYLVGS